MRMLIGAVLLTMALPSAAQLYRWTDASGRTHFTDTPPPPTAKSVQKRSAPAGGEAPAAAEPYSLQVAAKSFPVKLFSTPGCEACDLARSLLNTRGVPFAEVSVSDEASINELKNAVGSSSVPALLVGRSVQKGFEEGAYHRMLDAAGYPKTGILPPRSQREPQPPEAQPTPVKPVEPPPARGPYAPR
ncbi:MAG TPA: glutaredoxin family protein [Burkholderiales bacterium]|nr:glutaredoxin family protein [Burkholderiales bacterium]